MHQSLPISSVFVLCERIKVLRGTRTKTKTAFSFGPFRSNFAFAETEKSSISSCSNFPTTATTTMTITDKSRVNNGDPRPCLDRPWTAFRPCDPVLLVDSPEPSTLSQANPAMSTSHFAAFIPNILVLDECFQLNYAGFCTFGQWWRCYWRENYQPWIYLVQGDKGVYRMSPSGLSDMFVKRQNKRDSS